MSVTLGDVGTWIARHVELTPMRVAIHFDDEEINYRDLSHLVADLCGVMREHLALTDGARVAYLGANIPEALALFFACARTNLVFVPLNWRLAAPELAAILEDCGASVLFVEDSAVSLARKLTHVLPQAPRVGIRTDAADFPGITHRPRADPWKPATDPTRPLLIVYTSGTTGRPKGAVLTAEAVTTNALNSIHMHSLTAADRVLTCLPLFHVGGLNIQTTPAFAVGATVILQRRFEPGPVLRAIADAKPTLIVLVPATLQALIESAEWATTDLASLRAVTTGSTDVPRELIDAWHARGVPVIQVYGATETAPLAIYQQIDEAYASVGALGRVGLLTEVRLVNARGDDCIDGEAGEVWVRGAHVARGYWNKPDHAAFADGWFRSGDIAVRGPQGRFWFKDRGKNVIISGGENIYPAELERILSALPAVKEGAVVGQPDPRWGAVPIAVIVPRDANVSRAAILQAFDGRVARYKIPKAVIYVDALPRNVMGKVDLGALSALIKEESCVELKSSPP